MKKTLSLLLITTFITRCIENHPAPHSDAFKAQHIDEISLLKKHLVSFANFPKPGITFVDFLPIFADPEAFHLCIELLYERYKTCAIDVVVGLESRGFLIGAALAHRLGVGFVPIRKAGKRPGASYSVSYTKEYGTDTLEISQTALKENQRILIVDDLIATGGSACAAITLVEKTGAIPIEFVSLLEIKELADKASLPINRFNLID